MQFFIPNRKYDDTTPEMMDVADSRDNILRDDLRNLRTINKLFGGLSPVRKYARVFIEKCGPTYPVEILDLATGSADHPVSLVRLARSMGRTVRITAIERNPHIAAIARERTSGFPEIAIEEGDVLSPGFSQKSFDIVLCSLALHHFSRKDAVRLLAAMSEISRLGMIVNDLERSWPAAWTAWLYTHLTTRNPMTLNDSYVSVLRAFTPQELRAMASDAAVPNPQICTGPFFRLLLIGTHELKPIREPGPIRSTATHNAP